MRKAPTSLLSLLVVFILVYTSCSKNDAPPVEADTSSDELLGSWAPGDYLDQVTVYNKTKDLKANQYGYIFKTAGALTIRSSASWCGTPMTYADYDGTWQFNGGILTIHGRYWGGKLLEKWEISSLSNHSFSARRISTEFPR